MGISSLEVYMLDEYFRCKRNLEIQENHIKEIHVKGYISMKKKNGKEYPYLQWREGNKIKSKYLKPDEFIKIKKALSEISGWEASVKDLKRNMRQLEKALGKELIDGYRERF